MILYAKILFAVLIRAITYNLAYYVIVGEINCNINYVFEYK